MPTLRNAEYQDLLKRNVTLPLLLLIPQLLLLAWLVAEYGSQARAVDSTLRSIADANSVLTLAVDAETGLRGYRLSKDKALLEPYNWAKLELPNQIAHLRDDVSPNPAFIRRVDEIELQFHYWLVQAEQYKKSPEGEEVAATLARKNLMDGVRAPVYGLVQAQRVQLTGQEADLQRQTIFLSAVMILSVLIIGGILGLQAYRSVTGLSDRYEALLQQLESQSEALSASKEELEARVEERTAELESANKELEQFTYAVAHDLRAPLRWILSSNEIFREDFGHLVPQEALQELTRVNHAAVRLSRLIDNLLEFANFGKAEIQKVPLDVTAIAKSIASELEQTDWGGPVECKIQEDMRAVGDPVLIHVALQNLMQNAFKFSSRSNTPTVEVAAAKSDGETIFSVHDNGVGFDMRQKDKLFTPFERLHAHGKYEGSGIGLANTQRIIERHGGRIWAESAPLKGTTFSFTLGVERSRRPAHSRPAKTGKA